MQIWRHIRAVLLLPFMATVAVPLGLVAVFGGVNVGWGQDPTGMVTLITIGSSALAIGLTLFVSTHYLFAKIGKATLAPWDAPTKLVVHGVYRYVRNPMISGIMYMLTGETLILGCLPILIWTMLFVIGNVVYIPLIEEPILAKRFGQKYDAYRSNVPRWIPRLRPWSAPN